MKISLYLMIVEKISKGDDIILKSQLFYLLGQENLYILVLF